MDLLIRLSDICEMNYLPLSLSKWRMSDESLCYNNFELIIKEKKIFIKKLERIKKNDPKFYESKLKYMDVLYRQQILLLITKKKIFRVFGLLKKLKLNIKNIFLIIVIFIPFKKFVFKNFFNLKY